MEGFGEREKPERSEPRKGEEWSCSGHTGLEVRGSDHQKPIQRGNFSMCCSDLLVFVFVFVVIFSVLLFEVLTSYLGS